MCDLHSVGDRGREGGGEGRGRGQGEERGGE